MNKRLGGLALAAVFLGGCSSISGPQATSSEQDSAGSESESIAANEQPQIEGWQHVAFPGKTATQFQSTTYAGRPSVAAYAASSASMLRRKVRVEADDLGLVTFSWIVPELNVMADMSLRDKDDSVVRLVLAFEGDRSRLSMKDQMLSELALTLTGEEMPYATLMYVWCNHNQVGHVIHSPRTGRIRSMVIESGPKRLNQWLDYQRDIRADFEAAFGEAPGALVGVGIMTDSDNTRTKVRSWYGAVNVTARNNGTAGLSLGNPRSSTAP